MAKKIKTSRRLRSRYRDACKAAQTLQDILRRPSSTIVRDAAIKRFEYTFEALWKFLKEFLKEKEGIGSRTPKSVFREIGALGFLTLRETTTCLEMTDRRNETVHTYQEVIARRIFRKIPNDARLIEKVLVQCDPEREQHQEASVR